jgi:hypothetical protein
MKLENYLEEHEISTDRFAEMINVSNRMTVHRYLKGQRIPRPAIMNRILSATNGNVGPQDFFTSLKKKKNKLTNNFSMEKVCWDSEYNEVVANKAEQLDLTEHTIIALNELGDRAKYKNNKFYLDERPSSLKSIFEHANELRIRRGIMPLHYPGLR